MNWTAELFEVTDDGGYACPICHQAYELDFAINVATHLQSLAWNACCDGMEITLSEMLGLGELK